ncbi:MAG TPA: hypothetical protein VEA99_21270 [Gemmatimonadaceae bacterium]|nr:hypothetical protein [Gemmatimonadaceae bacterium]
MDCSEFREKHVAFVDDVLSAAEMAEMQRHARHCCRCARHDTSVRRGLLLARNIPQIEPSADFMERLQLRLRELEPDDDGKDPAVVTHDRGATYRALVAATVLAAAGLATALTMDRSPAEPIRLQPVIASVPADPPTALASPAVVASLATGIPVWPAVFMMSQPEEHLITVELREGGR